jgi:hypothetical protein
MKIWRIKKSGGEGGIRTPGRSFGPYNGLASCSVPGPVARNQRLTADGSLVFGPKSPCSGTTVPQLFPNHFPVFHNIPTFPHIDISAEKSKVSATVRATTRNPQ